MSKDSTRSEVTARWLFADFELADELRRAGAPVELTPKALALLRLLVRRAGTVVTKQEIWDEVWPRVIVTDAALTVCMTEVRRALGDDARAPRYLATVARRGYRFIAAVTPGGASAVVLTAKQSTLPFVGRETAIESLTRALTESDEGHRRAVFVIGEPGIGKTTLLEAFRHRLGNDERTLIIEGQCAEHFGSSEPYLPLLDGLSQRCRNKNGERLLHFLSVHAPLWLMQMPALSTRAGLSAAGRNDMPTTPERMLRELTDAIEGLAADQLVVLCLEDLHWSDQATLDWLNFVIRRRIPARLLLLLTLRDVASARGNEFLRERLPDLLLHTNAREVALVRLSQASIEHYLADHADWSALLTPEGLLERFARLLYVRTEGNPLYLVSILENLWANIHVRADIDAILAQLAHAAVPDSLRHHLSLQIEHVGTENITLLEAASVAGDSFSSALVSAALNGSDEEIERHCDEIARTTRMLQRVGTIQWPDQTVSSQYAFAHSLYREVLYERLPAGRCVRMHRLIGERLELAYAQKSATVASELAMHFGRGNAHDSAARHSLAAGRNALARAAYNEALSHFRTGLDHLNLAVNPASDRPPALEWELCVALGQTLLAVKGWASSEAEEAFARAHRLAVERGEAPPFLSLWGSAMGAVVRGDFVRYEQLGRELSTCSQGSGDTLEMAAAHWALGQGAFHRGEFHDAERSLQMALVGFQRAGHAAQVAFLGVDYEIFTLSYLSHVQWCMGKVDLAMTTSATAIDLANELGHVYSSALAFAYASTLSLLIEDAPAAARSAKRLMHVCRDQGFEYYLGWGRFVLGWCGNEFVSDPLAEMSEGLVSMRASGARLRLALYQSLLAERYADAHRLPEALQSLDAARDEMVRTRERCWESELARVDGKLSSLASTDSATQEARLRHAIEVARSQNALSWELRSALPLARLLIKSKRGAEGRRLLLALYQRFSEGFDSRALQEASMLMNSAGK